jgi:6-phosphofructokinase
VIHSIVKRHHHTYGISKGKVYGVYNSFKGMRDLEHNLVELDPQMTEEWLDQGGSKLGIVRDYSEDEKKEPDEAIAERADEITNNLQANHIYILYVLGGMVRCELLTRLLKGTLCEALLGFRRQWITISFGSGSPLASTPP